MPLSAADVTEIEQLVAAHYHHYDRRDPEPFADTFTEDGVLDLNGRRHEGRDALAAWAETLNERHGADRFRHWVNNIWIEGRGRRGRAALLPRDVRQHGRRPRDADRPVRRPPPPRGRQMEVQPAPLRPRVVGPLALRLPSGPLRPPLLGERANPGSPPAPSPGGEGGGEGLARRCFPARSVVAPSGARARRASDEHALRAARAHPPASDFFPVGAPPPRPRRNFEGATSLQARSGPREGREPDPVPLTPALSREGRGSRTPIPRLRSSLLWRGKGAGSGPPHPRPLPRGEREPESGPSASGPLSPGGRGLG